MLRRSVPAVLLVVAALLVGAGVSGLKEIDADLAKADRQEQVKRQLACERERRQHAPRSSRDS